MNRNQEKLLVATLCGLIITGAAAFAVQPAMAASHARQAGTFAPQTHVWLDRCLSVESSADWCLADRDGTRGWVNSRFVTIKDIGGI